MTVLPCEYAKFHPATQSPQNVLLSAHSLSHSVSRQPDRSMHPFGHLPFEIPTAHRHAVPAYFSDLYLAQSLYNHGKIVLESAYLAQFFQVPFPEMRDC